MDSISPDQYSPAELSEMTEQAFQLLRSRREAVLAMSSGGCARYIFSTEALYCIDRNGYPLIHYSSANPHHHMIMTNSSMDLRLVHQLDADGIEASLLILTGMLRMVDPGDHDSIDRYTSHYNVVIENYARGAGRLYRFEPSQISFERISGERIPVLIHEIIKKNPAPRD